MTVVVVTFDRQLGGANRAIAEQVVRQPLGDGGKHRSRRFDGERNGNGFVRGNVGLRRGFRQGQRLGHRGERECPLGRHADAARRFERVAVLAREHQRFRPGLNGAG